MGYFKHQTIVINAELKYIQETHTSAVTTFGNLVSNIVPSFDPERFSFMIAPDCIKEGLTTSDFIERENERFCLWLDDLNRNDIEIDYVYVCFGGDYPESAKILDRNKDS